jgi:signal transduction histidine kinase
LNNIVENALKYTNNGQVNIYLIKRDGKLGIVCEDNGVGMTLKQISSIYNKENEGHGDLHQSFKLGWSILVDLIEKNNLQFEISSEVNVGTQIIILIPD